MPLQLATATFAILFIAAILLGGRLFIDGRASTHHAVFASRVNR